MKSFFIITSYSIASFASDQISGWLFVIDRSSAAYSVQNAFTLIEYSLFALLIYLEIHNKRVKKIVLFLSFSFYCTCIYNYISSPPHFDSLNVTLESILIIAYCIYFFFEQINIPRITFIYAFPQFWITAGILIYLASTFFLFMQADSLTREARRGYWIIAILSQIIRNVLFIIAFLTKKHKENSLDKFDNQSIYTEF
ncbi:hypothetical protein A3860_29665 [Niastella vici]|uniref:7TM-DISM receptor extracellular domain-containing protein n=1 Tax=Niastella vici TaxID=1703345 RepID=A0A1V9FUW4_9BACT|nr:hypothetical protein [Niastella vici]OQP62120.1 hypothetical protein A3860_29665 [Niastella vici]